MSAPSMRELTTLIERTDGVPQLGAGQVLVRYDPRNRRVVESSPGIWPFRAALQNFVVTVDRRVHVHASPLLIPTPGNSLRVDIRCGLLCPSRAAIKMVGVLARGTNPAEELDRMVREAAQQYADQKRHEGRDLVCSFFRLKREWETAVSDRLLNEAGLDASVTFDVGGESLDDWSFKFGPEQIAVRGCREQVSFTLDAKFGVSDDPRDQTAAMLRLRDQPDFKKSLHRAVTQWITEHGTIQDFCLTERKLNAEKTLRELTLGVVQPHGRRVQYFRWEPKTPFELPEFKDVLRFQHPCRIRGCEDAIEVAHEALLELDYDNLDRFLAKRADNVERWLGDELKAITQQTLFDMDYVQVAIEFYGTIEDKIRHAMERKAADVGLIVRQFSSLPAVEPLRWTRGFPFSVVEEFDTTYDRAKVKLRITGEGRVTDLNTIRAHIRPRQDLAVNVIQPEIKRVVASKLRNMTPGRFYLEFASPSNQMRDNSTTIDAAGETSTSTVRSTYDERVSVEQELTDAIKAALFEAFKVECPSLAVSPADTELTDRMRQLMNERPSLSLTVSPQTGPAMTFHIAYQVVSLVPEHWDVFLHGNKAPDVEIADITELIRKHATRIMSSTLPFEVLQYHTNEQRAILERAIFHGWPPSDGSGAESTHSGPRTEGVVDVVARFHGLGIQMTGFTRDDSEVERLRRDEFKRRFDNRIELERADAAHLTSLLHEQQNKERDLLSLPFTDDESLATVRKNIADLQARLLERTAPPDSVSPLIGDLRPFQKKLDHFARALLPSDADQAATKKLPAPSAPTEKPADGASGQPPHPNANEPPPP